MIASDMNYTLLIFCVIRKYNQERSIAEEKHLFSPKIDAFSRKMIETLRREDSELRSTLSTKLSPNIPLLDQTDEFLGDISIHADLFSQISYSPPGALAHSNSGQSITQNSPNSSPAHIDPALVSAVDNISCIHSESEESYAKPSYYATEVRRNHASSSRGTSPHRSEGKPPHDVFEILYKDAARAKEHRRRLEEIFYPPDEHFPRIIGNKNFNIQVPYTY